MCDVCVCGGGGPSDNRAASVPQERSHCKSKTEDRSSEFFKAVWVKKGAMTVKSPSRSWELGSPFKAMLKRRQLPQKKGAWKLFTLGERQGQREAVGNREEQVFGGWTQREERPEKRNWPLPPLRDPLVTVWRETALSPFLSKRGCGCLQHLVLSDHPFKSPH